MPHLFKDTSRLPLIAPSILSADFASMGDDCAQVLRPAGVGGVGGAGGAGADLLHIDVMDGHFVPNLTMGPALVKSLRAALPGAFLDVHVMVTDPGQYIQAFAEAGADHYTFHIEPALDPKAGAGASPLSQGYDPLEMASRVRAAGMTVGLAVNPPTPVETILDIASSFDLILVMSVNPGFSGQAFIPEVLSKVERVRAKVGDAVRIQMDGGIKPENSARVRSAGCDVLVAASAIFGLPRGEWSRVVADLRGL